MKKDKITFSYLFYSCAVSYVFIIVGFSVFSLLGLFPKLTDVYALGLFGVAAAISLLQGLCGRLMRKLDNYILEVVIYFVICYIVVVPACTLMGMFGDPETAITRLPEILLSVTFLILPVFIVTFIAVYTSAKRNADDINKFLRQRDSKDENSDC